jgi:hypothetical protein
MEAENSIEMTANLRDIPVNKITDIRRRWADTIKMDLKVKRRGGMDWIDRAEERD